MPSGTKLETAFKRMAFHLDHMRSYSGTVLQPVLKSKDANVHEFYLQTTVVMLLAFLEEFFSTLVGTATVHQPKKFREYFTKYGNAEKQRLVSEGCDLGKLWRLAGAECSFRNNGKKLKRIFREVFGFSPFPDQGSEELILDLNLVRNVIAHQAGWPNENYAKNMRTPGVIVISREIDTSADGEAPRITRFYRLDLRSTTFVADVRQAVKRSVTYIHDLLKKDARYSLIRR